MGSDAVYLGTTGRATREVHEQLKACGYRTPGHSVETKEELQKIVCEQGSGEMPLFIDVHVRQGIRSDMPKLNIDHKAQKAALMENLKNK